MLQCDSKTQNYEMNFDAPCSIDVDAFATLGVTLTFDL